MSRKVLPQRRSSTTFDFEHGGLHYTATYGLTDNGLAGEVFLNARKRDSGTDSVVRDAAIAVSLALQFGAPLETLRRAMTRNADGITASSPIGKLLDSI